ncbi:MAG: uroporphyrinogen-III C-methyltransferase [Acidimicrobiales bacterium]
MTVYLVGAGPGDPGLITRRGAALLARADVVLFDRLVDRRLLDLAPAAALRVDVGKRPGERRHQDDVNAQLVEHGRAARTVVRLKGGDPFVFGRGGEEAEALAAAGLAFEVVPGVTSAFAAPASAGTPVTHRGLSSSVTVVTGHAGDPDGRGAVDWEALARAGGTLVILMGMAGRADIARRLVAGGRPPTTPVLVVHRGTTPAEHSVRTTLSGLAGVDLGPPCTIVVGAVAALDLRSPTGAPTVAGSDDGATLWAGPLDATTVVVTRASPQGAPLVAALVGAGASVVELPVIAVVDAPDGGEALRREAARPGAYDWVLFTSANAVERFMAALPDARLLAGVGVAAVGAATAAVLRAHHVVADLVPDDETAEGLVAALGRLGAEGDRRRTALFPRADDARAVLAAGLRSAGWDVTEVVAYRTVAAGASQGADAAALRRAGAADVVTFTSPSTVAHFVELVGERGVPPVVACIGPVTADAARRAGLVVDVTADEHSVAGLVAALSAYVAGRGGGARSPA